MFFKIEALDVAAGGKEQPSSVWLSSWAGGGEDEEEEEEANEEDQPLTVLSPVREVFPSPLPPPSSIRLQNKSPAFPPSLPPSVPSPS